MPLAAKGFSRVLPCNDDEKWLNMSLATKWFISTGLNSVGLNSLESPLAIIESHK